MVIGAIGAAVLVAQAALGWGLGVVAAGVTVLVAGSILAVLVFTDAFDAKTRRPVTDGAYDLGVCLGVAIAVTIIVGCLYLPMPWGGLCAATALVALVAALRLR